MRSRAAARTPLTAICSRSYVTMRSTRRNFFATTAGRASLAHLHCSEADGPGLDTNLLVTTDRRAYYLRLASKPDDYVSRVAFEYPAENNNRRWQEHRLAKRSRQLEKAEVLAALVTADV